MRTENLFIATLSIIINKNPIYCVRWLPYKKILVKKEGKYPNENYYDIHTGIIYKADKQQLEAGDTFIDTLVGFNYVTGNKEEKLSKRKILNMFDNEVKKKRY